MEQKAPETMGAPAPKHHATPVPCDTCLGTGVEAGNHVNPGRSVCSTCHGAGYEHCQACGLHLSSHDGRGHYQTHTGAVVCSLRCARLVRMRQARDQRELAAAESAGRAGRVAA